ncbi:hypothetical protein G9A89_007668 [Geosiphon pyriformis]|nr:hypothetical protein G9A89_007668 [Geosiphon pyriformis]
MAGNLLEFWNFWNPAIPLKGILEFWNPVIPYENSVISRILDLGLTEGCCPAESVLTYYINARINYHIEKEEEPHDAKLGLKHANKTKENLETNQKSNQQKLGTPAQTPKKTVTQSIKKQRIYSPEDKSYHFSPENKIQILLGAASLSTSTPQMPRTPSYTDKIKQQESELESKKETSKKTITRPVTGTSSQFKNQETCDQEEELDIKEATFRNAQGNIISPPLRPINSPAENGNKMTTPYIARLTDFLEEEEETDMHTWLRETQKAIQANNWNDQRAIQILPFFLKGTANSDPNAVIQLQNEFNTIKQNTGKTVTQYLARFNRIRRRVRPAHPNSLPEAVTLTRVLESAKKEANHSQMVNMVMEKNKTETLKKRVTQLGEELSKKIKSYLIPDLRKNTYQPLQRRSQEVSNSRNNCSLCQKFRTETRACHFCKCVGHLISQCRMQMMQKACKNNYYAPLQMPRNQYMPIPCQYPTIYQNQGAYQQQSMIANPNWHPEA